MSHDDDDGFHGYVPTAVSLGPGLMAGAVLATVLAYGFILPFLVIMGGRREAQQKKALAETFIQEDEEDHNNNNTRIADPQEGCSKGDYLVAVPKNKRRSKHQKNDSKISSNSHKSHQPGDADEVSCSGGGSITSSQKSSSSSNHSSELSSAVAAILGHPRAPKNKKQRKRRRIKEKQVFATTGKTRNNNSIGGDNSQNPDMVSLLQAIHPGAIPAHPTATVAKSESNSSEMEDDFLEETVSRPDFSATLSPSDNMVGYPHLERSGDFAKLGVVDKITTISAWDMELKRIIKLSMPYCTQALITGITDTLNVAVIGKLIGTREVSAYVIVNLLVELTSEFVGGLHEALATLCSQAIGVGNKTLAGKYVQIVTLLYTAFFIPFMFMWAVYIDAVLRWFGFDEETVQIGQQYCYILIVDLLFDGLGEAVHGLLDVGGLEQFSTLIGATEEISAFVVLLLVAMYGNVSGLVAVGLIQFGLGVVFLVLNISIIYWKGWFKPYRQGMIGTFALRDAKAVWLVCRTAMSLSFGMLLTDGEWEILTILASEMGPAEVAAWGILDSIWQGCHELIDGIADAGEVRCAFLLGSGHPERAKLSAYKSMMVGTFTTIFLFSLLYIAGDDLPTLFTDDPALQHILRDLLPLFGLAFLVMGVDTISWTLLGSQGRYRLATIVVCFASWFVTLPLALLFTLVFNVNLQGQTTAIVIGYLAMGIAHMYLLLRSNWQHLSLIVMEENDTAAQELAPHNSTIDLTHRKIPSQSSLSTSVGSRTSTNSVEVASNTVSVGGGDDDHMRFT